MIAQSIEILDATIAWGQATNQPIRRPVERRLVREGDDGA